MTFQNLSELNLAKTQTRPVSSFPSLSYHSIPQTEEHSQGLLKSKIKYHKAKEDDLGKRWDQEKGVCKTSDKQRPRGKTQGLFRH